MTAGSDTVLDDVRALLSELREQLEESLAIKIARVKLGFWRGVVTAASVILGVVFAAAVVATAVVFVFSGLAGWLGEVTSKPYLGSLLAGLSGLLVVGVALIVVRARLLKKTKANDAARDREDA